ncbi:MAG: hypothetical protein U0163_06700 [Gemmatimonadaceae bacterium]
MVGLGATTVALRSIAWTADGPEQVRPRPPRLWIDPELGRLPKRPWREVCQDFHNVHIINFSPMRTGTHHPQFCEDPIPCTDVRVRLRLPTRVAGALALIADTPLRTRTTPDGVEFTVPRIPVNEVVCLDGVD